MADQAAGSGELAPRIYRRNCMARDHLVGLGEQRGRHGEAKRLGGLAVDDQFELGRLLDGEVGGLSALTILSTKVAARRKRTTKFGP